LSFVFTAVFILSPWSASDVIFSVGAGSSVLFSVGAVSSVLFSVGAGSSVFVKYLRMSVLEVERGTFCVAAVLFCAHHFCSALFQSLTWWMTFYQMELNVVYVADCKMTTNEYVVTRHAPTLDE